ncbi:aminotransferase class V-fold PLP-dependent enzyme [Ammoniphilus sp. CFH 90114]|uniref:aminotransferase class V-fold PLP-dependent enzyme n=1 Tax=Ammoniphilus sp. CFH 90114 TaxID=2493665 RepID=UPI00100E99D0|nr:aminotransferase class V-fold PLP-dependent enzyme [Ammoniphilus sp. CFH 90114]RXT08888.1 aminotransferase class V-fold PLP-dependent enzyme [Ammoniphilus sp. CFH 90114]
MEITYLDNAASTWPKPTAVKQKMVECLEEYAANPGRGGHQLALRASKELFYTRAKIAKLFHVKNPNDIVFTLNATAALNLGIRGLLKPGDHVITTTLEHNSVRRPLEFLKKEIGVEISYVKPNSEYIFELESFRKEFRFNTALVVVSHASNLIGALAPVEEIGRLCKEKGVPFMVDASQSAGVFPIDVEKMNIQLLAFPGHKGLYGPQGTGGLYIHPELEISPIMVGGTGSHSEAIEQPLTRPDRYESGTQNTVGIVGLGAGVDFVLQTGVDQIREKEFSLTYELMSRLEQLEGVTLYGQSKEVERAAVVAFSIDGLDASEAAFILDHEYGIAVRSGYHCTPLGHETIGTLDQGVVRASFGYFNKMDDVKVLVKAIQEIMEKLKQ